MNGSASFVESSEYGVFPCEKASHITTPKDHTFEIMGWGKARWGGRGERGSKKATQALLSKCSTTMKKKERVVFWTFLCPGF